MRSRTRSLTIGRALGIGARRAGKSLLQEKGAGGKTSSQPGGGKTLAPAANSEAEGLPTAGQTGRALGAEVGRGTRNLERGTRNLGRGTRNFGRAVWNPFALATNVLWLEITGLFFLLFALFFAQHAYELRSAWQTDQNHHRPLLFAALGVLFLYFAISSFVRAHRKGKRR